MEKYYKINDKNLNFLIYKYIIVFKIIYVKLLRCMKLFSSNPNKQNIYLFYMFVANRWIAINFACYFEYFKYLQAKIKFNYHFLNFNF